MNMTRANAGSMADSRAMNQVDHLNRMAQVGLLSSAMVHDLNNLLQVVVGNLDAVAKGALDEKAARHVANARVGAERCTRLARKVMDRVRPDERLVPLRLRQSLDGLAERLRIAAGEGISVELVVHGADLAIVVDEAEFESALLNLVVNASDAMAGAGRVRISCQGGHRPDPVKGGRPRIVETVDVRVEDTGPGIPPELRDAVLEHFFTTKDHGTGHGLPNVRSFVEASGGRLSIDGGPGRGATVTMSFPRRGSPSVGPDTRSDAHAAR